MKRRPRWISKRAVLAIHERLLAEHGGASALLDEGMLDAALTSPKNHFARGRIDIIPLAAAYAHALTQNHPFADGNALTVAGVFMDLNGFHLDASEQDAAQAMRALSSREIDEVGFANWLRTCSSRLRPARRPAPGKDRSGRGKKSRKK